MQLTFLLPEHHANPSRSQDSERDWPTLVVTWPLSASRLLTDTAPRWVVWENVPGVLSSNGGRDFGSFLGGLGQLGYGFAYRVLDAQFVRVESHPRAIPQRRRRVFVVAHLGDWRRAAAVLFERESLCGHPPPRRQAGEKPAPTIASLTTAGGGLGTDFDLDGGLIAKALSGRPHSSHREDSESYIPEIVTQAMSSKWAKGSSGPAGDEVANLVAHSLRGDGFDASEDGTGRGTPLIPVHVQEVADPLSANEQGTYTHEGKNFRTRNVTAFEAKQSGEASENVSPTLRAMGHAGSHPNAGGQVAIALPMLVRRLTPRECERLQGFPDDYTLIPYRNRLAADGPRYKALGNSMAVNVMRWIGERIQKVDKLQTRVA